MDAHLALIHRLTNLGDINRLLHETVAKERALDLELDQLLSKRADLERSFLLLNTPTAEVRGTLDRYRMHHSLCITRPPMHTTVPKI